MISVSFFILPDENYDSFKRPGKQLKNDKPLLNNRIQKFVKIGI